MKYQNIGIEGDWFVRDIVCDDLNKKLPQIAAYLINNDIDYETDAEGIFDAMGAMDDIEFTSDEFEFIVQNIQCYTAIQELIEDGLVEDLGDGTIKIKK